MYTGRTFKSATFAWLLLDNRVHTKTIIQTWCLFWQQMIPLLHLSTGFDINKQHAVGVELQTFSINLNDIWDFGLSNETTGGQNNGRRDVVSHGDRRILETKRNELINLEQLAINIGDDDDNVGQLYICFPKNS